MNARLTPRGEKIVKAIEAGLAAMTRERWAELPEGDGEWWAPEFEAAREATEGIQWDFDGWRRTMECILCHGALGGVPLSSAQFREAYEKAEGVWDGCNWTQLFPIGNTDQMVDASDYATLDPTDAVAVGGAVLGVRRWSEDCDPEDVRAAIIKAAEYASEAANDATRAERRARYAVEAAEAGNWDDALMHADEAARIEREYGDDPTWGPFARSVREMVV